MSSQTKDFLDTLIKTIATILLGVSSVFLVRFYYNSEATRDSVIRLEVQFNRLQTDVSELSTDIKRIEANQKK